MKLWHVVDGKKSCYGIVWGQAKRKVKHNGTWYAMCNHMVISISVQHKHQPQYQHPNIIMMHENSFCNKCIKLQWMVEKFVIFMLPELKMGTRHTLIQAQAQARAQTENPTNWLLHITILLFETYTHSTPIHSTHPKIIFGKRRREKKKQTI